MHHVNNPQIFNVNDNTSFFYCFARAIASLNVSPPSWQFFAFYPL